MLPHRLFLEKPQVNRRIEYLDPTGTDDIFGTHTLWDSLTNEGTDAGRTMPRRTRRHWVAIDEGKRPPDHTVAVGVPD